MENQKDTTKGLKQGQKIAFIATFVTFLLAVMKAVVGYLLVERGGIMSKSVSLKKDELPFASKAHQQIYPPCKGQIIRYEGEEAKVISVKPLLVIKTKKGVICGDLNKQFFYTRT